MTTFHNGTRDQGPGTRDTEHRIKDSGIRRLAQQAGRHTMEGLIFASFQADGKSTGLTEVVRYGVFTPALYNELLRHVEIDLSTIPRR